MNNFEQRGKVLISTIVSSSNNIKRSKHVTVASTYGIVRYDSDLIKPKWNLQNMGDLDFFQFGRAQQCFT